MTRAAVLRDPGKPLSIEDIELAPTRDDQVRVRIAATGVCHSDLSLARGNLPYPTPCVLGHEGAGVVTDVGADVTKVQPGDHVIIACLQPCRDCYFCTRGQTELCERAMADVIAAPFAHAGSDALVPMQGAGTFAEETLVLARSVVPIDRDIPLEAAALIGCAVSTGVGAVVNTAKVDERASVAVFGCGGVGLSVVQGARMVGSERIIAIDPVEEKRDLAATFGATETIDPTDTQVVQHVQELTAWRGVDYAFEVVGRSDTIRQAYDLTRRGGTVVVVGAGHYEDDVSFNALELMFSAKTIVGSMGGSIDPDRDFPVLVDAWQRGDLDLEALVTHRIGLDGVEEAFDRMDRGEGARSLVVDLQQS